MDYLKNLNSKYKKKILIVDNHTLTVEQEKLLNKYDCDLLKLEENFGFAKANNKGVEYLKEKYNPDLYCVMNNDVFISQKKFIDYIFEDYKQYKFDMLGPKISSPTGESVNPFPVLKTQDDMIASIRKGKRLLKIYHSSILSFLLKQYINIKYLFKKKNIPKNGNKLKKDSPLHGCCIIFSKEYIQKYNGYAFDNSTFLFHEEEFLYQRILNDNLVSIYDPKIEVFHKEGSSVNSEKKSNRKSKLFRESERIKSLELLLDKMRRC